MHQAPRPTASTSPRECHGGPPKHSARRQRLVRGFVSACLAGSAVIGTASAQMTGAPLPGYPQAPGVPSSSMPGPLREIGFDQRLDNPLPLDTQFRDEQGRTVSLGEYFGVRPVVLAFVYYECRCSAPRCSIRSPARSG